MFSTVAPRDAETCVSFRADSRGSETEAEVDHRQHSPIFNQPFSTSADVTSKAATITFLLSPSPQRETAPAREASWDGSSSSVAHICLAAGQNLRLNNTALSGDLLQPR